MKKSKLVQLETGKIIISVGISLIFFVTLLTAFFHLTSEKRCIQQLPKEPEMIKEQEQTKKFEDERSNSAAPSCNLFSGKWVFDNISYPLYEESRCSSPAMSPHACHKYGRKDLTYQNWRWQPHDCDLPRFNGTAFLEKIRGKKLVFVGDSLNRNQWISMFCLIESSLDPSSLKSDNREDNMFFFQSIEYNVTIGFYWSPFLVESNADDPYFHPQKKENIVRIAAIEKHGIHWADADILVFDSYIWWQHSVTLLWGSFESSDAIYKTAETTLRVYEMGLNTWSDWLEFNINRTKTKLFFMGLSPSHEVGDDRNVEQHCYNQTQPILKEGYWGLATDRKMMQIAESVIQKLETRGLKVEYLNITNLSDYRKDAHPSIYRDFFHLLSEEQLANPKSYADCFHWCLPGVPDVWNEILYSYIMKV